MYKTLGKLTLFLCNLDTKKILEDTFSSVVGVIVGGIITVYFGIMIYDKQELSERKNQKIQISGLKFEVYKDFLYEFGDATKVYEMDEHQIFLINKYTSALSVLGDKDVIDQIEIFYQNLLSGDCTKDEKKARCYKLIGNAKSKQRIQYEDDLKSILGSMNASIAIDKIEPTILPSAEQMDHSIIL